jgi:hypothetical protein
MSGAYAISMALHHVLNFEFWSFVFVSDFELRASNLLEIE